MHFYLYLYTLEHWLQECPAIANQHLHVLGSVNPPLSVLLTDPQEVILYARETQPVTRESRAAAAAAAA